MSGEATKPPINTRAAKETDFNSCGMGYYAVQRGYSFLFVLKMRLGITQKWPMAHLGLSWQCQLSLILKIGLEVTHAHHVIVAMSTLPHYENEARGTLELDYYPLCRHGNVNLPSL